MRVPSVAGLLIIAAAAVFFDRRSAYEERLLVATYADYDVYRARVRWKLVPGIR